MFKSFEMSENLFNGIPMYAYTVNFRILYSTVALFYFTLKTPGSLRDELSVYGAAAKEERGAQQPLFAPHLVANSRQLYPTSCVFANKLISFSH